MATWGTAGLVDEPCDLVVAQAAHHLALGAAEVRLFLDRDRPALRAVLEGRPGVRIEVCDDGWWAAHRREGRPLPITGRQQFVLNHAFRDWPHDWLFHLDADEFLMPARPVAALLDDLPSDRLYVHAGVAERVFLRGVPQVTIFDGVLRRGVPGDRARAAALPPALAACVNAHGLIGHGAGKSAVRRGAALRVGVHAPAPPGRMPGDDALAAWRRDHGAALEGRIAHFDGLTPLHWVLKLLMRQAQAEALAEPGGPPDFGKGGAARRAQVALVHGLRRDRAALAAAVEALLTAGPDDPDPACDPVPDIAAAARRVFPDLSPDFGAAAFDARLRAERADLIAAMGLTF